MAKASQKGQLQLEAAHQKAATVEDMQEHLGKHPSHDKAFAQFPKLSSHRQPLHDILRALFRETRYRDPSVFVNALLRNLDKMLWFPPEGWTHPARKDGESNDEWDEMEQLAETQRERVLDILEDLEKAAVDAGLEGVSKPSILC